RKRKRILVAASTSESSTLRRFRASRRIVPTPLSIATLSYEGLIRSDRRGLGRGNSTVATAGQPYQVGLRVQDLARFGVFAGGDAAAALEHVEQATGTGVADPQASLDHRDRRRFGLDHDANRLVEQVVAVRIEITLGFDALLLVNLE